MDKTSPSTDRPKHRSHVLHTLFQWTGRLYTAVRQSGVGRALTAYRRLDGAVGGGRQGRFRQASRARMPVADAVRQSALIALLRGFFDLLYDLPMKLYGTFLLWYGALGSILYFLVPLLLPSYALNKTYLVVALVMMVISMPPLTSKSTLRQSVSRSRVAKLVFNRYFCIPANTAPIPDQTVPLGATTAAVALAFVTSAIALFVSPYLFWIIAGCLIICGLVFSYPETGVLMGTVLLPVAWVLPDALTLLAGILLLTWVSYGFKLIRIHRTVRYDIADMAMLLLMVLSLISCVGGLIVGTGSLMPSILLLLSLSTYFLITHLMTTRAYISRCLFSIGASAVLMTVVALLIRMPAGETDWLASFRAGKPFAEAFSSARSMAVSVGKDAYMRMAAMMMPFLYTLLLRARRLFSRAGVGLLLAVSLYLIVTVGSLGTLICVVCVTILFCLLCSHRALGVGALLLPGAVGAVGWLFAWRNPFTEKVINRLSLTRYAREIRFGEMWQKVLQSPFGRGVGVDCEGGNLVLQILMTLGWQGLVVAIAVLVLLLHKSLTAVAHTTVFADRVLVAGLFCGAVGAILRGGTYGFLTDTPALLTLILFLGLGSAFANVLFDEHDVRMVESMDDPSGADRVYRRG